MKALDVAMEHMNRLYGVHPYWLDYDYAEHLRVNVNAVRKAAKKLGLPIRVTSRKYIEGKLLCVTTNDVIRVAAEAAEHGMSYGYFVAMREHPVGVRGDYGHYG